MEITVTAKESGIIGMHNLPKGAYTCLTQPGFVFIASDKPYYDTSKNVWRNCVSCSLCGGHLRPLTHESWKDETFIVWSGEINMKF